jgi:hypothetical protein
VLLKNAKERLRLFVRAIFEIDEQARDVSSPGRLHCVLEVLDSAKSLETLPWYIDVTYEVIVFYFKTNVRVFYSIFEDPPKSTLKYEEKLVCGLLASLGKYACI